ncbi:MAG: hypothetical protein ACI4DO_03890 [Roseburia sp.]
MAKILSFRVFILRGQKHLPQMWQVNIAHKLASENTFSETNFVQFNFAAIAASSFGLLNIQNAETQEGKNRLKKEKYGAKIKLGNERNM